MATVRLLERLGCRVEFPVEQTCCGQMHGNSGYREPAGDLAGRMAAVFDGAEAIVTPAASCAGFLRELLPELRGRLFELSEFLCDRLGVSDVGASSTARACYHPTCHSLRGLDLGDRPLRLLWAVSGLDLVELERADECCGFGGTFSVKNSDVSAAMLTDKLNRIEASGADTVVAVDNSCLMHLAGGLTRRGSAVRTLHLAELLAP